MSSRRLMSFAKTILLIVCGTIIGVIGTLWIYGKVWDRLTGEKMEQMIRSGEVGVQVGVLSHLRLGEVDEAIKALEIGLDGRIASLDIYRKQHKSANENADLYKALRSAKAYRQIYPNPYPGSSITGKMLEDIDIPPNWVENNCQGSICRLVRKTKHQN